MGHDENAVLDMSCRVNGIENLYHFSTAMFPSVKSASPTAAVCCFIEQHLATDSEKITNAKQTYAVSF